RLPHPQRVYEGQVSGEFGRDLPAEQNLVLKPGAQVMFVKNGTDWVNGTLGTVITAESDRVIVHTQDGVTADVVPESWEKYKYTFNRASERIE
ncbi:helicase, partial [Acinetobacter baumannii]